MTMGHDCKQMPDLGNVLHGVDLGVIGATGPNRPRRENLGIRDALVRCLRLGSPAPVIRL
jgi:hypothetical protein